MRLDIAQIGDPALRRVARPVSPQALASPEVQGLIDDLIDTMRAARGAGLAATQVRRRERICVIEVGDNPRYPYKPRIPLTVLVNPTLELLGDERFDNYEGCLKRARSTGRRAPGPTGCGCGPSIVRARRSTASCGA